MTKTAYTYGMNKIILSIIVLLATGLVAAILYSVIVANRTSDVYTFVMYLCAVTFFLGIGIFVSGLLAEKGRQNL